MEDLQEFVEQMSIIGWKEQRSWKEFSSSFKVPDSKNLEERVTANFLHYRTNYLIITASVFILRLLLAPMLFLCIFCCIVASAAATVLIKDPVRVGDFDINSKVRLIICGVVSFIILGLCGAVEHLLWGVVFSGIICCSHMIFRPRNISSRSNKVYEEMKINSTNWFGGTNKKEKGAEEQQDDWDPEADPTPDNSHQQGSMRKRVSPQGGLY